MAILPSQAHLGILPSGPRHHKRLTIRPLAFASCRSTPCLVTRGLQFYEGQTWLHYPGMIALLKDGELVSMEQSSPASATFAIGSEPTGAEIYADGKLLSSTPATVEVTPGNHQLTLKLAGYQDWTRNIHVLPASAVHFEPTLERK